MARWRVHNIDSTLTSAKFEIANIDGDSSRIIKMVLFYEFVS